MVQFRRLFALLLVALLVTAGPQVGTARAASTEAIKAADFIVSTFGADAAAPYGELGSAADSLLALVATDDSKYATDITGIVGFLKAGAADYVKADASGDSGAAKLALVAAATGESADDALDRADQAMYADKRSRDARHITVRPRRPIESLRPQPATGGW